MFIEMANLEEFSRITLNKYLNNPQCTFNITVKNVYLETIPVEYT